MLELNRHKTTKFAGMYSGIADGAGINMASTEAAVKDFRGMDENGYASKKPVLPYKGFISLIPNDGDLGPIIPLVGPGWCVTDTGTTGHAVTADIPIADLAKMLTAELKEHGSDATITVVSSING